MVFAVGLYRYIDDNIVQRQTDKLLVRVMLEDGHKYWYMYYKQFKLIRNLSVDVLSNISIFLKLHALF